MNVLVVDSDEMTCALVKFLLEAEGFSVSVAPRPELADRLLERKAYHIVVLDTQFNGLGTGLELCHKLREQEYEIPIIFIAARNGVMDRVAGLKSGADDFIAKPFDPGEFVARVRAVFRRYNPELQNGSIAMGRLKLNVDEFMVTTAQGREVALTPTEMRLLRHLLLNTGRTVTRESLMNSIWGFDYEGESNPVDVYVRRLRKKIEKQPSRPEFLLTVRGAGYKLLS